MKRVPIKNRIRKALLTVTILSVAIVSFIVALFMYVLKDRTTEAVIKQMEDNVTYTVDSKVEIAQRELSKYKKYIESSAKYLEAIYEHPESFKPKNIGQIDNTIVDEYSMQRTMIDQSIDISAISPEMNVIANIESMWRPVIESENNTIAVMYLGTEAGFMLSYDKYASYVDLAEDGELYFDFKSRPWYKKAKETNKTVFVDLSPDYFGRGLTFTCSTPFYKNGRFAGVMGMDILVSNLQKAIIDIDYDNKSDEDYAFIVNLNGDIVASPFIDKNAKEFKNINDVGNDYYEIREKILGGKTGIDLIGDIYCAYSPIKSANWTLCVHIPSNLVLKSIVSLDAFMRRMVNIFIAILIFVVVLVFVVSERVTNGITAPILKLKNDVQIISTGNLDNKVTVDRNDEISDLANSFNSMTASLKNYINDLTNLTAEKERIGAELNVATHIQSSMLPCIFPAFPNDNSFDIYATMDPAKEVGGDFYDFFKIDDKHLAIVVADVSGKGVPAALFMVIGKTLIKDHTSLKSDLSEVFTEVNKILCESNSENLFITAFEAVINLETGHVTYVNAGHEMPFIYKKGQDWEAFKMKPGFVLAGMENTKFKLGEFDLEPGDKIFQYTDGVTEATNKNNELYGMDRLKAALDSNKDKTMKELLLAVKKDIDEFVNEAPQFDDITMLGFELSKA